MYYLLAPELFLSQTNRPTIPQSSGTLVPELTAGKPFQALNSMDTGNGKDNGTLFIMEYSSQIIARLVLQV